MRIAILVSTGLDPSLPDQIRADLHPQQDFLALAQALGARLITPVDGTPGARGRASRAVNIFRSAWAAFRHNAEYDLIISDIERAGVGLALLFKFTGTRKRHIVICHGKIAQPSDFKLMRTLNLQEYIDCFVCYGPAVAQTMRRALGLPDSRVVTVRHAADHHFWRPMDGPVENLVVSAGMFHRDYPTLVEAVRGQDVSLTIAAHSPWVSGRKTGLEPDGLPPNVHITRCTYAQLRELYARARCVAIPLNGNISQSGSLVVYEAMAMGKPVLVTRTEGQNAMSLVREGQTGFYLDPGDIEGWRSRINHLCAHPDVALRMGRRAREAVEEGMNQASYVDHMVAIVRTVGAQGQPPGGRRRDPADISTTSVGG